MNISYLTVPNGNGIGWKFKLAADQTKHKFRYLQQYMTYQAHPTDLCQSQGLIDYNNKPITLDDIRTILDNTDVFILDVNHPLPDHYYGIDIRPYLSRARIAYYNHGGELREYPDWRQYYKDNPDTLPLVSTPDLKHRLLPKAIWIPTPCPIDHPLYQPVPLHLPPIIISHFPTSTLKRTELMIAAMQFVSNGSVYLNMQMGITYEVALTILGQSHLYFDQLNNYAGWYGSSSIEAASKGVGVIVNELEFNDIPIEEHPFFFVTEETFSQDIQHIVRYINNNFSEVRVRHRKFAETYYDYRKSFDVLVKELEDAKTLASWEPKFTTPYLIQLSKDINQYAEKYTKFDFEGYHKKVGYNKEKAKLG